MHALFMARMYYLWHARSTFNMHALYKPCMFMHVISATRINHQYKKILSSYQLKQFSKTIGLSAFKQFGTHLFEIISDVTQHPCQ